MKYWLLALLALCSCSTQRPRSSPLFGLQTVNQPFRAIFKATCNGQTFATQGVMTCEEKQTSQLQVAVKVPPLPGRIAYSNGDLKATADFNWKDSSQTWQTLNPSATIAKFGDTPVALDVMGIDSDVGVINTRGIYYTRVCNDQDILCSSLVIDFECGGKSVSTGPGQIGKCQRLAGSPQIFTIHLGGIKPGGKMYISIPKYGENISADISQTDIDRGTSRFQTPPLSAGATLVVVRLEWFENHVLVRREGRVLIVATPDEWTPLDVPHIETRGNKLSIVKPVLADLLEVDLPDQRETTSGQMIKVRLPKKGQVCAYGWQRENSDVSMNCVGAP